jgi:hypothetical protein
MTREHRAWLLLKERIDYLNTFAGNRSQMERFTKEIEDAWRNSERPVEVGGIRPVGSNRVLDTL